MSIRLAHKEDLDQLKVLLAQLTIVGDPQSIDEEVFDNIFVYVLEDKIVGCATLLVEKKIIHQGGKVGHIEDVTVDNIYRQQGIGQKLIDHCIRVATERGCYKVILDCDEKNVKFYEKCGFKSHGICMRLNCN